MVNPNYELTLSSKDRNATIFIVILVSSLAKLLKSSNLYFDLADSITAK